MTRVLVSVAAVVAIGCGQSPTAPSVPPVDLSRPFSLTAGTVIGTGESAGHSTISAKVQNGAGNPMLGATVSFTTDVGTITPTTATTDKDGKATASLTNDANAKVVIKAGTLIYNLTVVSEPPLPVPVSQPPVLLPPPPPPPTPQPGYLFGFSATPFVVIAGGSTTVMATVSPINGAGPATSFQWDCGNGLVSPVSPSPSTSCTYPNGGTFAITLTATGGAVTGTSSTSIRVTPRGLTLTLNCTPVATPAQTSCNFSAVDETGASATANIASSSWDWGDGLADTVLGPPHAQHVYPQPGTWIVRVTAFDNAGRTGTTTATITTS